MQDSCSADFAFSLDIGDSSSATSEVMQPLVLVDLSVDDSVPMDCSPASSPDSSALLHLSASVKPPAPPLKLKKSVRDRGKGRPI